MFSSKSKTFQRLKDFRENCKGTTAIVMAILMPITLSGLAFGSEYGYFELSKRRLQNAADTAAFAAGTQLRSGLGETELKAAALVVAKESGFAAGASDTLTLSSPPTSGAYAGNTSAVHVTLTQNVDRFFSGVYNSNPLPITTDATVLVQNGRPACVLSLNPSMDDAILISGSANVALDGCDLAANSISSAAVASNGNSVQASTTCVTTSGGVDDSHGNYTLTECPSPIENAPVTADPYGSVPEPVCAGYGPVPNSRNIGNNGSGPFCYDSGNINGTVNLASDNVYVFHNMNIQLNGHDTITGTNVTIFLSGNSSIKMNGNAVVNVTAPTTGTYSGIAFFGDRDNEVDIDLTGGSSASVVGAIYSPNFSSDILYTGNNSSFTAGQCTQIIAGGQVEFTGSAEFSTDCSNSGTTQIMAAQAINIVE